MIEQILPSLYHWSAADPAERGRAHSLFEQRSGTLIDPALPEDGLDALLALGRPRQIVLTNACHFRDSAQLSDLLDCPVLCNEAGLERLSGQRRVHGFACGERLAEGIEALAVGVPRADESALVLSNGDGAICIGDAVRRSNLHSLSIAVAEGEERLRQRLQRLFEWDFDAMLFAHAEPILGGGRWLLSELVEPRPSARVAR